MKRALLMLIIAGGCLIGIADAGDEKPFIRVEEERRFAESWEKPQFIIEDGKVVAFTPPVPNFTTRSIGFELVIINVHIKHFQVQIDPAPAPADAAILNREQKSVQVGDHTYHVLNGEVFRLLGVKGERAYFKHLLSHQVVAAPLASSKS